MSDDIGPEKKRRRVSADAPVDQQEDERHYLALPSASSCEDEHEDMLDQQTAGPADGTSNSAPSPATQGQTNGPSAGGVLDWSSVRCGIRGKYPRRAAFTSVRLTAYRDGHAAAARLALPVGRRDQGRPA